MTLRKELSRNQADSTFRLINLLKQYSVPDPGNKYFRQVSLSILEKTQKSSTIRVDLH